MEIYNVKQVTDDLNKYSVTNNNGDYITVTEWYNNEGYDIDLNGRLIQLSIGELDAINYLVKSLDYGDKNDE